MASLAYPGSMVSRGVSWSSSLSPHSGCLIYVFISAPASRRISIKIKRGRDLWISRRIFFTKEEPRFQYPLGTVSSPMQSLPFVCSDPNPTGLIFLMPSLWHLRALSQKNLKKRFLMRPHWGNTQSQLLRHSSIWVCARDELSTQGFKINFMQNGVWAFKEGAETETRLVQQIKL